MDGEVLQLHTEGHALVGVHTGGISAVQLEFRGADGQTHTQGSRLSPRLVLFLELAQDLGVEPFNGRMLALELRVQDAALVAALVEQLAATVPGLQIGIPSWAQQAPVWAYSASLRRWDLL